MSYACDASDGFGGGLWDSCYIHSEGINRVQDVLLMGNRLECKEMTSTFTSQ